MPSLSSSHFVVTRPRLPVLLVGRQVKNQFHGVLDCLLNVSVLYGIQLFTDSPLFSILQLLTLDSWVSLSYCYRLKHLEMLAVVSMASKQFHWRQLELQVSPGLLPELCGFCFTPVLGFESGCVCCHNISVCQSCIFRFSGCATLIEGVWVSDGNIVCLQCSSDPGDSSSLRRRQVYDLSCHLVDWTLGDQDWSHTSIHLGS